jgi:hypothetical protein
MPTQQAVDISYLFIWIGNPGIHAGTFQDGIFALTGCFSHFQHVDLLSVNTGFALCLIPVIILGLHEVAVAIKAYEQHGYENF